MSKIPNFDAELFDDSWERYIKKAIEVHTPFMDYLNAGASDAQLTAFEGQLNSAISPELKHLLKKHNGSKDYFVLPGWELFSTEEIVGEWKIWEELYYNQFKPENYSCSPEGPIRGDEWWRLKWIPFCGDGGGNHLCIDLEPTDQGTIGQIITMWHDSPERVLISNSLTEFVTMIAEDFENGELIWDEDWGWNIWCPRRIILIFAVLRNKNVILLP